MAQQMGRREKEGEGREKRARRFEVGGAAFGAADGPAQKRVGLRGRVSGVGFMVSGLVRV